MVSIHRTRQIARAAIYGGGGLLGIGAATIGVAAAQTQQAKRTIGLRRDAPPYSDRRFGRGKGTSRRLVILGDSVAAGLGADHHFETIGAHLAQLVADHGRQPVLLSTVAEVGARSRDLDDQVSRALHYRPDVAVVIIGANDVTHAVRPQVSVRRLDLAVRRLRAAGVQVVVGTCPDLGTVQPIRPPLRWYVRQQSRTLAAAQTVAVVEAGARAVSLGDLLGPEFRARPTQLFSSDRFHPSTAGYEAVAQVLAPSVLAIFSGAAGDILPELYEPAAVEALTAIAASAAEAPGTEVAPDPAGGQGRGFRARWGLGRNHRAMAGAAGTGPLPDSRSERAEPRGTVDPSNGAAPVHQPPDSGRRR